MSKHPHFTYGELLSSETAVKNKIDNTCTTAEIEENLKALMNKVLEPARVELGSPINVTSGFRCTSLNSKVGGEPNSQHKKGEAADLQCADLRKLFDILKKIPHDQLLYEYKGKTKWIHVSYKRNGKNRNETIDNYKA